MAKRSIHIPEIPLIKEEIIRAAERSKLIVFIGAGVSRIIGVPSWYELAQRHLEYAFKECGLFTYSEYMHLKRQEPRKLLSICSQLISPNKSFNFKKVLEDEVKVSSNKKYKEHHEIYKYLYDFNCPFITTNFDGFLDEIQKEELLLAVSPKEIGTNKKTIIYHYSDLRDPNFLNGGDIAHIHGSIHDPNKSLRPLVLSIGDYFNAYRRNLSGRGKNTELPEFLDSILNNKVVLFIGYGLDEYEILEYMVNNRDKREPRHFMLYPCLEEESNFLHLQEAYYKQLGINLIPYSISRIGYAQLKDIVRDWSKAIGKKFKPKNTLDTFAEMDSVIQ